MRIFLAVVFAAAAMILPALSRGAAAQEPGAAQETAETLLRAPRGLDGLPPLTDFERSLRLAPDGSAAVVLLSCGYKRDSWTESSFTVVRRVKILEPEGLCFARVEFRVGAEEYADGFAGRTILQDGRVLELDPDGVEIGASYAGIWGPEYIFSFDMPGATPGAVVEYAYTISSQLGPGLRYNHWFLQGGVITYRSLYTVDIPTGFMPLSANLRGISSSARPIIDEQDGRRIVTYSFGEVPALIQEPLMPPPGSLYGVLVVDYQWPRSANRDPVRFWLQFGHDEARRADEFIGDCAGLKDLVAGITGGAADLRSKAEAVCRWVRGSITDLGSLPQEEIIEEGELLHEENTCAGDVLRNRYGSRREISLLALAMLREAGLEAYQALAVNRRGGVFDRDFLDHRQFDQSPLVVVLPDEGLLFLHPAAPHCPPLRIPWYIQGSLALVCTPKGGSFARVPVDFPEENVRGHSVDLVLDWRGNATGIIATELTGQEGIQMRDLLAGMEPARVEAFVRESVRRRLASAEVARVEIEGLEDAEKPLRVSAEVRIAGYALESRGGFAITPGLLAWPAAPDLANPSRSQPVYFPYPFTERLTERVELPEGCGVEPAEGRIYHSDVGSHEVRAEFEGRTLTWRRETVLRRVFFDLGEYLPLRHFYNRVNAADTYTIEFPEGSR